MPVVQREVAAVVLTRGTSASEDFFARPLYTAFHKRCARTKHIAVWLLAVGIFIATALSPSATSADASLPRWSPGDAWQWTGTMGPDGPFVMTLGVLGAEMLSVSGATFASYHTEFWINLTSGAPDSRIQGDLWYRQSDLSVLQAIIESNVSASGVAKYTSNVTYTPPPPLRFPLVANDTWLATTTGTVVATSPGQATTWENITFTFAYKVGPPVEYTVSAGTFTTMAINVTVTVPQSYSQSVLYYWSRDIGNSVTGPFIAPGLYSFGTGLQLVAFRYVPPSGSQSNPPLDPLLTFIGGVAVGSGIIAALATLSVHRRRRNAEPGARPPEPPTGSKP